MQTTIKVFSQNSDFQYLETLRRNRVKRNHSGIFFVEGVRAITQAVERGWEINSLIFSREKRLSEWAEGKIQKVEARNHYLLSLDLMEKLSDKEDASELIALVTIPIDDLSRIALDDKLLVVVLDRPSSPGNIGTIIRSCDALGASGIIVSGHAADLYDPETIRATTGSFFCIPSIRVPSHKVLIPWFDEIKKQFGNLQIVGTSAHANSPLQEKDFTLPTVLLIGNETNGLSDAYQVLCDAMVTIPMTGYASSLNVACATSIALYEAMRQRIRPGM
jgi:23S rRNA (uridine2479-2'-O)-methyltransferase